MEPSETTAASLVPSAELVMEFHQRELAAACSVQKTPESKEVYMAPL